jgi:2-keto-4-pentenoate hydratase/2-oxohepta-3-ene-1,7-dioic acid hydratase in catechol pathway
VRIARVSYGGGISFGVIEGEEVAELDGPPIGELRFSGKRVPLADCRLLAPTLPSKIVAVGLNYRDHAEEMGQPLPEQPLLFLKPGTAVIGAGDVIRKPAECQRLDYEGELAVVIGGLVRNADRAAAEHGILGYTVGNDVTARDLQIADGQWTRGKGYDTFCPLGPWIVTDVDASGLDLEVRLNGETKQHSNTKNLIFDAPALVSFISGIMTLLPGDVIMTGTPSGVGPMEPGDAVEVEISGIGPLSNGVASAPLHAR